MRRLNELKQQVAAQQSMVPERTIGQAYSPTAIEDIVFRTSEALALNEPGQLRAAADVVSRLPLTEAINVETWLRQAADFWEKGSART